MSDNQWPFPGRRAALLTELEATLAKKQAVTNKLGAIAMQAAAERDALLAMLKRTTFLLSSARLIVADDDARFTATEAVNEANALIKRVEAA